MSLRRKGRGERGGRRHGATRIAAVLVTAAAAAGLSGCYESPKTAVYKPGVYKGAHDPLLDKQADAAQQNRLRQRLDLVQRDR